MNSKILAVSLASLMCSTPLFAASDIVAQVTAVKGDVKVENAQGKRTNVSSNMQLANGSTLIVLKGNVTVKYKKSECKQTYSANTLVSVNEATQCVAGQQISVGATGAPADDRSLAFWMNPSNQIAAGGAIAAMLAIGLTKPNAKTEVIGSR
jgi:hypothetical protein